MLKDEIWAIIPARSGSVGLKNKNIKNLNGKPLIYYTIEFAKKLSFIDKIFLSTDSQYYADIANQYGVETPFLRSDCSSTSEAMEEDILLDIYNKCVLNNIKIPKSILWLRPTHPLRSLNVFENAYKIYCKKKKSVCVVTETDGRIFYEVDKCLIPIINSFKKKSMVRRQDCKKFYKIFSGEFFSFPTTYNKKFLGNDLLFIEQPKICSFDIDSLEDFNYLEFILKNNDDYRKYIHGY